MKFIDIDIETRSHLDVKKAGAFKYAEHPSTEILIMCYSFDQHSVNTWIKGQPFPSRIQEKLNEGWLIRCHNWAFEYANWKQAEKRLGWPIVHHHQFYCTMALANRFGFPSSLEQVLEAINSPIKKDKRGTALIQKFSKLNRKKEWNEPDDHKEDFQDFIQYCKTDVLGQIEIADFMSSLLSKEELDIFRLSQDISIRGIPVDVEMCKSAVQLHSDYVTKSKKEALEKFGIEKITSRPQVLKWLHNSSLDIPNLQGKTIKQWLPDADVDQTRVLELHQECVKTSIAKYSSAINTVCNDNTLKGTIQYYGAQSTGRFAGRLFQPQNLARPTLPKWTDYGYLCGLITCKSVQGIEQCYGSMIESLSSAIRSIINCNMVVADYAQIEARLVFWFADEQGALLDFKEGKDIYCSLASEIFKRPITKTDEFERFVGKQGVLGLGFQMGAPRFRQQCLDFSGIDIGEELAINTVDIYRSKYKKVKKMWYDTNKAAINAVKYPGTEYKIGKIRYVSLGHFLYCTLPSGRFLTYPFPRVEVKPNNYNGESVEALTYMSVDSTTKKWTREQTFGGKLVENYVQGTARDIMVDGMLRAEKAGFKVFMNVHDEILAKGTDINKFISILKVPPTWGRDIPLNAEGWAGDRYRK